MENPQGERKILSKFEDGLVYFTFTGLLPTGLWQYRAKLYTDTHITEEDVVTVDAVLSSQHELDFRTEVMVTESLPVVVVAQVTERERLVRGASVTALVLLPDNTHLELELVDNGLGYPDVTAGDGLYTGYLPRLASIPGYYSVLVTVRTEENSSTAALPSIGDSDCCGSLLPSTTIKTLPATEQLTVATSLYLQTSSESDTAPPNRISDLRVMSEANVVTLQWTAPGGDWTTGRAAGYSVKCQEEADLLYSNTTSSLCEGMTPALYGTSERCEVSLAWDSRLHCAVRAVDSSGNKAQLSNIVEVVTPVQPTSPPPPVVEVVDTHTKELLEIIRLGNYSHIQELIEGINSGNTNRTNTTNNIYIATGVMAGIVAVIVLLLMVMIYRNRRKQKLVNEPVSSAFPVSDIRVRQQASESPTLIHSSKLSSTDGSSKVLLSWLEDLPTSSGGQQSRSPQRQRMLTNGSFVKLQESSSECGSTQHTMSTLDETRGEDSHTSDSSASDFYNNYACNVRRSATLYNNLTSNMVGKTPSKTATLNRRQYSRNHARIHNYSSSSSSATLSRLPRTSVPRTEYSSATLGRVPRTWDRAGSCEDILNSQQNILTHLSETDLYYGYRQGRKVKRTESFV